MLVGLLWDLWVLSADGAGYDVVFGLYCFCCFSGAGVYHLWVLVIVQCLVVFLGALEWLGIPVLVECLGV